MTDLQLAAGLLNASRNANRAREAAERQLEEARSAARYAQQAAAAARDGAEAEKERLALEKERFAAEQRDRSLRAQALEQQQAARELLADALQECSELAATPTPPGPPEHLLRRLAGLQAKVLILDGSREALTELADKTAVRQLRQQAAACVQGFADRGLSPRDPWAVVQKETARMRAFAARGNELLSDTLRAAGKAERTYNTQITHDNWQTLQEQLQDLRSRWPAQLAEMRDIAAPGWWDADGTELDPEWQGLLLLEALIPTGTPPEAKSHAPEEVLTSLKGWKEFSEGQGYNQGKVQTAMDRAQKSLTELNDKYLADLPRWQQVLELAEAGNYQRAEDALRACHNLVRGADYRRCVEVLDGWKAKVRELAEAHLPQELQRQAMQPWPLLPHSFRTEMRKRRELLAVARKWLGDQQGAATQDQETDFSRQAASALTTHTRTVDWATSKTNYAVWGRRVLEVAVVAAVVAAAVLLVLTSVRESRDERQRAEIRREAGEIAARRALRSAGEKLQAVTARLLLVAEQQRQVQAAQQAQAARQTQATRQQTEEADRQQVQQLLRETAERQQRFDEAAGQRVKKQSAWEAELAEIAQAQEQEWARRKAAAPTPANRPPETGRQEIMTNSSRRQKLLETLRNGVSDPVYGTVSLNLGLAHGYITMRAGARYQIRGENPDGSLTVYPLEWRQDGAVHLDTNSFDSSWDIGRELQKGVRIKPEYLTTNNPN